MSAAPDASGAIPQAGEVLLPQSQDVQLEGLDQSLLEYAVHLGYIHWLVIGAPLLVMSARDTATACSPLHAGGLAVDLRTHDLADGERQMFHYLLAYSAPARNVLYTVGLAHGGVSYVHLEVMMP